MAFIREMGSDSKAQSCAAKITGQLARLATADPSHIRVVMARLEAAQWEIDWQSDVLIELSCLALAQPEVAAAISDLLWVKDGLTILEESPYNTLNRTEDHLFYGESRLAGKLVNLARDDPQLVMELAALPRIKEGVNLLEDNILSHIE